MKKSIKILSIILITIISLFLLLSIIFFSLTRGININEKKLYNIELKINYYDTNNKVFFEESNGRETIEFDKIPKNTINAFISIEDRRFYKHKGVDYKSLSRAFINNIKSFSFKEGASTITQQLVKNTHLTSDKTIARKLKEIKLAKKLEKRYSKNEILEKYLNTIYFGDGCYGINKASMHYFNKSAEELSLNESAVLASIIKAPSTYSPTKNKEKNLERKNLVLKKMLEEGFISDQEYEENISKGVQLNVSDNELYDYKYLARQKINKFIENNPYQSKTYNVYTYCNLEIQNSLIDLLNFDDVDANKGIILLDNNNKIIAYLSTTKEINRQIGSTIKPLGVYAPALEEGNYYLCSKINDEKININGYSPSNFNDKYYGEVTFKKSLEKSLNSPAIQILNTLGVDKSVEYLKKMNFDLTNDDLNLSLALGSTVKGQNLSILASSYSVFRDGNYTSPSMIKEISTDNNTIIYQEKAETKRIFREDTANLMKLALKDTVKYGTAKNLSFLPFELCSKTGTVGNEKGNTDAYNISFNDNLTLAVWYGNKNDTLLNNNILGGTNPTVLANELWKLIDSKIKLNKKVTIEKISELQIDKELYDTENVIMLADDNAPTRYKQKEYFGYYAPKNKSTTFSHPVIEKPKYSVNYDSFSVELCQTKFISLNVYVIENNERKLIYTKKPNEKINYNYNLKPNMEYTFIVTPFFVSNERIINGEDIIIAKIKTPSEKTDGEWWIDDL